MVKKYTQINFFVLIKFIMLIRKMPLWPINDLWLLVI